MGMVFKTRFISFLLGVLALVAAHHWFNYGSVFVLLQYIGFSCLVWANVVAWLGWRYYKKDLPEESKSWFWIYMWQKIFATGFFFFFAQKHWFVTSLSMDTFLGKACLAFWLICIAIGLFSALTVEWSNWNRGTGHYADSSRQAEAFYAGLAVALVLSILVCLNYVTLQRNRTFDVSYLKTTAVSQATKNFVAQLKKELKVFAFFPTTNEVKPYVQTYLREMILGQSRIQLEELDKDLNPVEAKQHDVVTNGQIVLVYGSQKAHLKIGTEIMKARKNLRTLDKQFQKAFVALTSESKVAYFTRGHGEMTWDKIKGDPKQTIRNAEKNLARP